MLINKTRTRLWNRIAAWLIVPSAVSLSLASAQEPTPAPPVQEIPVRPATNIPPPPADGLAPKQSAPDTSNASAGSAGGCGPFRAVCNSNGAASVPQSAASTPATIVCTPAASGGACGPAGTCRVSGNCNNGPYCQTDGYQSGISGYGCPGNGMPCMGPPGSCLSPDVCMGRPYTVGDLKRSLFYTKCRTKDILGLNNCDGCSPLHLWWHEQQHRSRCKRAYRNHVLGAHFRNKFNYFFPSGCCGEGCGPFGVYNRVYATEPHYADARDSQVYAAPGTGVTTIVPLAPNVRHQYNYSWGMPSSRLTPISNVVLPRR